MGSHNWTRQSLRDLMRRSLVSHHAEDIEPQIQLSKSLISFISKQKMSRDHTFTRLYRGHNLRGAIAAALPNRSRRMPLRSWSVFTQLVKGIRPSRRLDRLRGKATSLPLGKTVCFLGKPPYYGKMMPYVVPMKFWWLMGLLCRLLSKKIYLSYLNECLP